MAIVVPFTGIRYKSIKLSKLICPPYDVISEYEKKLLLDGSKYNFVRIELPEKPTNARRTFREWLKKGILISDSKPAIYVYQQEFKIPIGDQQKKFTRTGVFTALKIEQGRIYKHEKITSVPVEQRLKLLREVKANTSAIFGLFEDTDVSIRNELSKIVVKKTAIEIVDPEDVIHRLWIVNNPEIISNIVKKFTAKYILIADGHHRYQTALLYNEEIKQESANRKLSVTQPESQLASSNYILAYLCPIEDTGVVILATHRVVKIYPDIEQKIKQYFNISCWDGKSKPQIVCYCNGEFKVLSFSFRQKKESLKMNKLCDSIPAILLHNFILDEIAPEQIFYTKDVDEAVKKAQEIGGYAFLLEPPALKTVYEISKYGIIMPPKTTYFYPKVPAGLVVYSLSEGIKIM